LREVEYRAQELNVKIEKPARRLNSSFIFTAPDCNHPDILTLMRSYEIFDYEVFNPVFDGVQKLRLQPISNSFQDDIITRKYLSYDEANVYIENIAAKIRDQNPDVSVNVAVEGYSFEFRQIKSITIAHNHRPNNPVIFLDAGIHAREWHSRSMALYLLYKLANEALLDKDGLLYKASFVIVPGANPDGYEYSRRGDKMWRKNRRPLKGGCVGVDGNRNYDARWEQGNLELNPCNDVYRGPKPFSEPETKIIRDIMLRLRKVCKMYISLHTFGNSILYPYGYTHDKHPREAQLLKIAQAGVDAVAKATGGRFHAGQSGSR
jgi:murein tripeptide amidase MpaA